MDQVQDNTNSVNDDSGPLETSMESGKQKEKVATQKKVDEVKPDAPDGQAEDESVKDLSVELSDVGSYSYAAVCAYSLNSLFAVDEEVQDKNWNKWVQV